MKIAITVDIEKDIGFMDSHYGIDEGLPFILDILKRNHIKATFFINGEIIDYLSAGGFLKRISEDSHEIASHGYRHTDYREWDYEKIRDEICKSKNVLETCVGTTVRGYRAPQFLLSPDVVRAIEECGFTHDSSLPDISGISAAKMRKVSINKTLIKALVESKIKEFPIDSVPVVRIPHGILWVNFVTFSLYKLLFRFSKKDFMIFYMHAFDLVRNKRRVKLNFKRSVFYLRNQSGIYDLFEKLIRFWVLKGVEFVKLEDQVWK
jgi:hypothetical protein